MFAFRGANRTDRTAGDASRRPGQPRVPVNRLRARPGSAFSFVVVLLASMVLPVGLADGGFNLDGARAEASTRKKSSGRQAGRASSSSSNRSVASSRRTPHSKRSRGSSKASATRGRQVAPPKPPPPSPEQIAANARRESSYQTMAKAYRLYDEGINARMAGDNTGAVAKLSESWKLFNDAKSYQRTGEASLAEALVHYELGQAAEGTGDLLTARDSYVRCLNIRPALVEASVRLVGMLATAGQWQMALAKAQDAVRSNPTDPRARQLMSLTLSKTGHTEEAKAEAQKAQELLRRVPNYKPMGIDAVWKRMHKDEGSVGTGTSTGSQEGGSESEGRTKSDVDNPEELMGDDEEVVDKQ